MSCLFVFVVLSFRANQQHSYIIVSMSPRHLHLHHWKLVLCNWKICKSTTMINLHWPFINMGWLHRTHMLVVHVAWEPRLWCVTLALDWLSVRIVWGSLVHKCNITQESETWHIQRYPLDNKWEGRICPRVVCFAFQWKLIVIKSITTHPQKRMNSTYIVRGGPQKCPTHPAKRMICWVLGLEVEVGLQIGVILKEGS
jgi:hypothetical protein